VRLGRTLLGLRWPLWVRRHPGAFELNGHLVYPDYGVGIERLGFRRYDPGTAWKVRSHCLRCGQSIMGGAEHYWRANPCPGRR
jgi:hypothetical protein